jgi:hypothetical protein
MKQEDCAIPTAIVRDMESGYLVYGSSLQQSGIIYLNLTRDWELSSRRGRRMCLLPLCSYQVSSPTEH